MGSLIKAHSVHMCSHHMNGKTTDGTTTDKETPTSQSDVKLWFVSAVRSTGSHRFSTLSYRESLPASLWNRVWHTHTNTTFHIQLRKLPFKAKTTQDLRYVKDGAWKGETCVAPAPPPPTCPGRVCADFYCSAAVTAVKVHRGLALALASPG